MRHFDEADAALDKSATEEAALAELSAVLISQVGRFLVDFEDGIELGSAEFQALVDGGLVAFQTRVVSRIIGGLQSSEKLLSPVLAGCGDALRSRQSGWATTGVGEVEVS